jgi:hypothetical protein
VRICWGAYFVEGLIVAAALLARFVNAMEIN